MSNHIVRPSVDASPSGVAKALRKIEPSTWEARAEGYSSDDAVKMAGKSAGHLLKRVLIEDENRTYRLGDAGMSNGYTWIGDGPRH